MDNELIIKEQTALAESIFDSFDGNTGFENVTNEDLSFPFLRMAQKATPQADKNNEAYIEGLDHGHFFNTATAIGYGNRVRLIFLAYFRSFIEWEGEGKSAKYKGQLLPAEFEPIRKSLRQDGSKLHTDHGTYFQETRSFFVMNADNMEDGIMLFPLKSTGIPHAKKVMSMLMNKKTAAGRPVPMWGGVWELWTSFNSNPQGDYFTIGKDKTTNIKFASFIDPALVQDISKAADQYASIDKSAVNMGTADDTLDGDSAEY